MFLFLEHVFVEVDLIGTLIETDVFEMLIIAELENIGMDTAVKEQLDLVVLVDILIQLVEDVLRDQQ